MKLLFLCLTILIVLLQGVHAAPRLEVIACDVGQGDAILLTYGSLVILIDTGPNSRVLRCLQANLSPFRSHIDLVILTHGDLDHIGGFSDVVKTYKINRLWLNPKSTKSEAAIALQNWTQKNRKWYSPLGGEILVSPGFRLTVLWSEAARQGVEGNSGGESEGEERNADSIAVYVEAEGFGFFSLGDLECPEELAVSLSPLLKKVHVAKMSHHGAKTSSCAQFLETINPEVVFYSSGADNRYGHPATESLEVMRALGIPVLGTDRLGTLRFQRENDNIFVRSKSRVL